jgi:hypothetical protein
MIGNFVIFGDSYSTHKDYIPSGYQPFYSDEISEEDIKLGKSVKKMTADKTWWWRLSEITDATLTFNDSWSGSTVCYSGREGDCSATSSFIYRYRRMYESGFFDKNKVDTIFVFGLTNDNWIDSPLGEEKYEGIEEKDLYSVLPAICYLLGALKKNHPEKRIVFIENTDFKPEIQRCVDNATARFGVELVKLHDIDKDFGHPTPKGMAEIAEQIKEKLGE